MDRPTPLTLACSASPSVRSNDRESLLRRWTEAVLSPPVERVALVPINWKSLLEGTQLRDPARSYCESVLCWLRFW